MGIKLKFLHPILKKSEPQTGGDPATEYSDKMEIYHGLIALQIFLCCICLLATFCPNLGTTVIRLLGKVD